MRKESIEELARPYWYWGTIPIGTYQLTFQVEVPVTNEPEISGGITV